MMMKMMTARDINNNLAVKKMMIVQDIRDMTVTMMIRRKVKSTWCQDPHRLMRTKMQNLNRELDKR